MLNVNKTIIAGNLGKDPELRSANGKDVCTITVATNEYRGKGDEREQFTEWHCVVLWGQFARFAGEHLHKGANVYIEGRLQNRKWQDSEGKDQYTTEIVAEEFQAISRGGNENQGERQEPAGSKAGQSRSRR